MNEIFWDSASLPLERHAELARYVLEDSPAIQRLVKEAEPILKKETGDPAFDAYVSERPGRVDAQVKAIYQRLGFPDLTWRVEPPQSRFTKQRVRLAEEVLDKKVGTCLDLTLLIAGCLRQAGIHPLIIIVGEGEPRHAVLGYWLEDRVFRYPDGSSRPVVEEADFSVQRRRIRVVEATDFANPDKPASFLKAQRDAATYLPPEPNQKVWFVVDIEACRRMGIEPVRRPSTDLPQRPDVFIGRTALLAGVRSRINAGGLTVIAGIGGVGKTALVLRATWDAVDSGQLPGGVAWIRCEDGRSYDEYWRRMSHVFFGDRLEQADLNLVRAKVLTHLAENRAMVVLDNLENARRDAHLRRWLKDVRPPIRVLAITQRVPQELGRSAVFRVPELPDKDAVALFSKRAGKSKWSQRERESAAELCSVIGNLPLAIELLAPLASVFPLSQLLKLLKQDMLKKAAPGFQKEIFACFELSCRRLSRQAQDLLWRLSVLPDGAGAEVLTAVCRENWDAEARELVSASLWRLERERYVLHPLVRQFALHQLKSKRAAAELDAARAVTPLAQKKAELTRPGAAPPDDRLAALDWIESEWRNLLACADFTFVEQDWKTFGDLADAARYFFPIRGYLADAEKLYERAVRARHSAGDPDGEARALHNLAAVYRLQNRLKEAEEGFLRSLEIRRREKSTRGEASTLCSLVRIYQLQKRWKEAESSATLCLTILQREPDASTEARTYNYLGHVYLGQEMWEEAEKAFQRSLNKYDELKEPLDRARPLRGLGEIYMHKGELEGAAKVLKESLKIRERFRDHVGFVNTLNSLGRLSQSRKRWAEARGLHAKASKIARQHGYSEGEKEAAKNLKEIEGALSREPKIESP